MFKQAIIAGLAALAATAFCTQASAAQHHAQDVRVHASVFSLKTDNGLEAVSAAIAGISGAEAVMTGQSDGATHGIVRVWSIASDTAHSSDFLKAMSAFDVSEVLSTTSVASEGHKAPLKVTQDRDYVRAISFEPGRDGVPKRNIETASVTTGYHFTTTPSIRKDGIHLALEQKTSRLTGPDDGFRNYKTEGGVIQLKELAERDLKFNDVHMPASGKSLAFLQDGDTKGEFLLTVIEADKVR